MAFELDEYLRHQVQLSRLETGGLNAVVFPSLEQTVVAIRRLLAESDVVRNRAQLQSIVDRISSIVELNGGWDELESEHLNPLAEFESQWYADYTGQSIDADVAVPAQASLAIATRESLMTLGTATAQVTATWADFVNDNLDSRKKQFNSIVKRGFARGQTTGQMATEIRRVSKGLLRREAEALARTGYIHYAAQADKAVAEENADILEEYYYVVTFDSRTTKTCRSLATRYNPKGNRAKVGDESAPTPPLHFNCRTRRIAVPKGTVPTGKRAAVGGEAGAEQNYDRGQIGAGTTHQSWLKRQPKWFVEDSLGPMRAELFRNGGLTLDKFTDMSLRPLTLEEIKEKYSREWDRAFGETA